ncbi:hypothetical protein L204_103090 [Cryptococcus depauperatus]
MSLSAHLSDAKQIQAARLEDRLKQWAMALPKHLAFDQLNLSTAVRKINSRVGEVKVKGWMYAYMHAIAECGMFYLQAVTSTSDPRFTAKRQNQAVENLMVIMDAIGEAGREGCFFATSWQEHLEKSNLQGDANHRQTERLNRWWAEMAQGWGVDRSDIMRRGFYSKRCYPSTTDASPGRIESIASPATTPSHNYRFNLPPLRPRAASGASLSIYPTRSPSPHHLPSVSAWSDRRERDELVSLPSLSQSISHRYLPHSLHARLSGEGP